LTESLLESELFGHVKGAFTGASNNKKGFFEAASGGTIFLDEFAEMSLNTQQRLLRVLQERTVRPIGITDPREIKIDTRVVVATNHDLKSDVSDGRFRKDLYYRVNVLEIRAPALRERPDDIPLLASHFIRRYNEKNRALVSDEIGTMALKILKAYAWPGNVRELENLIKGLALKVGEKRLLRSGTYNKLPLPCASSVTTRRCRDAPAVRASWPSLIRLASIRDRLGTSVHTGRPYRSRWEADDHRSSVSPYRWH
jgi:transcriptional regulator with PAS, ATPase and Fis domain